jgi:hypothetical protein
MRCVLSMRDRADVDVEALRVRVPLGRERDSACVLRARDRRSQT